MALTKIQAGSFEAGAIETADLSSNTTAAFAVSLTPKVTTVNVANSSYVELDDTAVSTNGGYVIITGSDFQSGAIVLVDTTQATSTTYVNSTTLRAQLPAKSAATYNIYVVNPDGGVGIKLNGVNYSATPTWVTSSPLANVLTDTAFTGTFEATGATSYSVDSGSSLPDGMTLVGANGYYYGTITVANDTTYSFTINATDAENQDSPATFNLTAIAVVLDQYFNSTVLLLQGDGTNGAQNQTFVDSSTNNFTITRYGNVTQGSFSPFSPTGWSNYFDGSGDSLSIVGSTDLSLDSDFTLEFFIKLDSLALSGALSSNHASFTSGAFAGIISHASATNKLSFWCDSIQNGAYIVASSTLNVSEWYHVALVRSSGVIKLYLNGVEESSFSSSATITLNGNGAFRIGKYWNGDFNGYISNLRVVKGSALYTAAFTPPTIALTAITNTKLLTCQSNRFVDNSTNNFAITRNGDAKVVAFSPFAPTEAYSTSTHGGSAYFDGTDDALTLPSNSALALGDGDFTVEAWVYNQNGANLYPDIYSNSGSIISFLLNDRSSVYTSILSDDNYPGSGNATLLTATAAIYQNTWTHVAWARYGSSITVYINGIASGTVTSSTNHTREMQVVGAIAQGGAPNFYFWNGYISNFRVVKGTAVYTSAFTPPTTPPTVVSGTSLLLNFTNAGIYDATAKNVLETVGNAQVSTAVKKYGTGSIYFDGTVDHLIMPDSSLLKYGFGDFTLEFWINVPGTQTSGNSWVAVIAKRAVGSLDGTWAIDFAANTTDLRYRLLNVTGGTVSVTIGTLTTNQWYHVAISKENGTTRTYLNGVASGTTTSNVVALDGSTEPIRFGWDNTGSTGLNGYIDDLRITKGIARYTSNFTPPTAELPVQ